jgi:REP element-mobilizing transposase RayT
MSLPHHVYLVTFVARDRQPIFQQFDVARAASAAIVKAMAGTDAPLLAWVLMPDHAHFLMELGQRSNLSSVVRRVKTSRANAANRTASRQGSVWTSGFHDHALRKQESLRDAARYIVSNPVRAGIVDRCGDYSFWDAVWITSE